jgi:hypothetical protein
LVVGAEAELYLLPVFWVERVLSFTGVSYLTLCSNLKAQTASLLEKVFAAVKLLARLGVLAKAFFGQLLLWIALCFLPAVLTEAAL